MALRTSLFRRNPAPKAGTVRNSGLGGAPEEPEEEKAVEGGPKYMFSAKKQMGNKRRGKVEEQIHFWQLDKRASLIRVFWNQAVVFLSS